MNSLEGVENSAYIYLCSQTSFQALISPSHPRIRALTTLKRQLGQQLLLYSSALSAYNAQLAGDIYGAGVRVGIYIQVIGLLLAAFAGKGRGIKLSSGAMTFALLISLSSLMHHNDISPAESLVVLGILNALLFPAMTAFMCRDAIAGEGIAMVCCLFANLWTALANIIFWARLYRSLPSLGTPGMTWTFYKTAIQDHQTRIGSIIGVVFELVLALFSIANGIWYVTLAAQAWGDGTAEVDLNRVQEEQIEKWRIFMSCVSLLSFIFCVAQVEMTIKWNGLQPDNNFSHPGQSIPLIVGVFVLLDGAAALLGTIKDL
jgi:hypothetical protein